MMFAAVTPFIQNTILLKMIFEGIIHQLDEVLQTAAKD